MKVARTWLILGWLGLLSVVIYPCADAASEPPPVEHRFISVTGMELTELSAGAPGEGWLLYYNPDSGPDRLKLVVRLVREVEADAAWAYVYAAPPGEHRVPITIGTEEVRLDEMATPVIKMQALGGWWVREGMTNYNLEVQVNGPVVAMWGVDVRPGTEGWTADVESGQPAVRIRARDSDGDGIPDWDFRSLIPPFPGRGYLRSNYAERMCDTPTEIEPGVSPLWPYVAFSGGYEQSNGQLRPPIVVDWDSGRVMYFSEMVSVRNQNCSYSFYTIKPLVTGQFNQVNWEAPFAFYDLSGQGVGYPNLILRTARFPKGDPWGGGPERSYESIRYSWRNGVGDWLWDYKVEVLGFHPYDFETPIAGGETLVDAPPYDEFPVWVVERAWPLVTFVDTEEASYLSSEGIYEWSAGNVGSDYFLGRSDAYPSDVFASIREGLRGEYRVERELPPGLYLSPIDNRLHLLGADGGVWNLGEGLTLREQNLDGDLYLDAWVKERISESVVRGEEPAVARGEVVEALYALEDMLIYAGRDRVELRQVAYSANALEVSPPTDGATWRSFRDQVEPLTSQKRDPADLAAWLAAFPGKGVAISGASLEGLRPAGDGFRFVLDLALGYSFSGPAPLGLRNLRPGTYVVDVGQAWVAKPLTPPKLGVTLRLAAETFSTSSPGAVEVVAANQGLADAVEITLVMEAQRDGETVELLRQEVDVLAGEPLRLLADWQPKTAGAWELAARLEDRTGEALGSARQMVDVSGERSTAWAAASALLSLSGWHGAVAVVLASFAGLLGVALRPAARRRRPGEEG